MQLRPYQVAARDAIVSALDGERRSALAVLPTGTGKTVLFAAVADALRGRGRALVLAHREELITQARDKIQAATSLRVGIEMAERRAAAHVDQLDVVVASIQTLGRESRRARFRPDAFGLVVVDEAHHATSSSYRSILEHFAPAKVLGVTATPDRGDGVGLRAVFEHVAFEYPLRQAIADGWLVPIRQKAVQVADLDLSKVRTTAGDLNAGDLETELTKEGPLHGVAWPVVDLAGERPTIVFATTVPHAHALAAAINAHAPDQARALDGGSDPDLRRRTLAAFAGGEFRYLVNCALFTEGFDCPSVACIALARPTKSRALFAQMVGRGTRLAPGKSDCLVLDFRGNAGRHALVTLVDALAGRAIPDKLRARAQELLEEDPQLDLGAAITKAEGEEEARARAIEEHRQRLVLRPGYRAEDVDPFVSTEAVLGMRLPPFRLGQPARQDQLRWLQARGIPMRLITEICHDQAQALCAELQHRERRGLCSYRQAETLAKYGYDSTAATAEEAMRAIAEINQRLRERARGARAA